MTSDEMLSNQTSPSYFETSGEGTSLRDEGASQHGNGPSLRDDVVSLCRLEPTFEPVASADTNECWPIENETSLNIPLVYEEIPSPGLNIIKL